MIVVLRFLKVISLAWYFPLAIYFDFGLVGVGICSLISGLFFYEPDIRLINVNIIWIGVLVLIGSRFQVDIKIIPIIIVLVSQIYFLFKLYRFQIGTKNTK